MTFFKSQKGILLLLLITLFVSGSVFAQKQMTGTWKAKYKEKQAEKIHISFYTDSEEGDHQHGSSFKFERLQGLTPGQVTGPNSAVSFTITSEAGNIDLRGSFDNSRGKGTFVFTPDRNFAAAIQSMGFKNVSEKDLFASAVLDVKLSTVSELRGSGIAINDYDDVFKATIFKIDSAYISEMAAAGFDNLDMEDLVKGRIFKIDGEYARQVISMGFGKQSLEELVKFRIFKVTPEFLSEMRAEGFTDLSPEQVVQFRIFKIDAKFIREMRANGYPNATVEELVQLRIRGRID
ncbi:MAG: hypothetical protein OEM82_14585 [Acidobacteriota bacterium]|nr:hypothetical protein [Acidobacteriota bacterium]MDH3531219.1 hypothetical protein [Acidobacteriota bacterium]